MANQLYTHDFFVSYTQNDGAWVEGYLLDGLTQAGLRCLTQADLLPGAPYLIGYEQAIAQSHYTLLVLSPSYLTEVGTQLIELLAHSYGVETSRWPVIPLLLQATELPLRLRMLTPIDASTMENWPGALRRLCRLRQCALPLVHVKKRCPYPGMAPFQESDSSQFFGRTAEIDECVQRLRLHRFLAIIGCSGSGKSSLLTAGLVPALRNGALSGFGNFAIWTMRPGGAPLATLAATLASTSDKEEPPPSNKLLIVDQLEEIFAASRDEASDFMRVLQEFLTAPCCHVVIAVRADFYSDIMACPLWPEFRLHRVELVPLDAAALRQAITRPAVTVGVYLDSGLVDQLVFEAANEPGSLPLVQETLVLLWERLERRYLPQAAYATLADGRSLAAGTHLLQQAIARRADAALAALSQPEQAIAQRIFLRLIQFGEGRADTRRQQLVAELRSHEEQAALFDSTLYHLSQRHRLLTLSGEEHAAGRKVDLAHEALIAAWPTLRLWIGELRQGEKIRRQLESRATQWYEGGGTEAALLNESELARAAEFLAGWAAQILGHSSQLAELIATSRTRLAAMARDRRRWDRQERIQLGLLTSFIPGLGHLASRRWVAGFCWLAVGLYAYVLGFRRASEQLFNLKLVFLPAFLLQTICVWQISRLPKARAVLLSGVVLCLLLILGMELVRHQRGSALQTQTQPLGVQVQRSGGAEGGLQNGNFEQGPLEGGPRGWFQTSCSQCGGYRTSLVETSAKSGRHCALIDGTKRDRGTNSFGNLMQSYSARPYIGRLVRFKVAVRTALPSSSSQWNWLLEPGLDNRAQLWLRIDRPDGSMAFLENMDSRPIKSSDWRDYEITTIVPADASTINVGAMLIGTGKVWLDDASFELLDSTEGAH